MKRTRAAITREQVRAAVYSLYPVFLFSGIIGNWIVRWQNGRPVISRRPENYNTAQTSSSIASRKRFAAAVKLAKFLNGSESIKEIWSRAELDGTSSFNKIIKHNINLFEDDHPTVNNIIVPPAGKLSFNCGISFNGRDCIKIDKHHEKDEIILILAAYEPEHKNTADFTLMQIKLSSTDSEIRLSEQQILELGRYRKYILYSILIRKDGNVMEWSDTCSLKGKLLINISSQPVIAFFNADYVFFLLLDSPPRHIANSGHG